MRTIFMVMASVLAVTVQPAFADPPADRSAHPEHYAAMFDEGRTFEYDANSRTQHYATLEGDSKHPPPLKESGKIVCRVAQVRWFTQHAVALVSCVKTKRNQYMREQVEGLYVAGAAGLWFAPAPKTLPTDEVQAAQAVTGPPDVPSSAPEDESGSCQATEEGTDEDGNSVQTGFSFGRQTVKLPNGTKVEGWCAERCKDMGGIESSSRRCVAPGLGVVSVHQRESIMGSSDSAAEWALVKTAPGQHPKIAAGGTSDAGSTVKGQASKKSGRKPPSEQKP